MAMVGGGEGDGQKVAAVESRRVHAKVYAGASPLPRYLPPRPHPSLHLHPSRISSIPQANNHRATAIMDKAAAIRPASTSPMDAGGPSPAVPFGHTLTLDPHAHALQFTCD
jgi:hypothetical protein